MSAQYGDAPDTPWEKTQDNSAWSQPISAVPDSAGGPVRGTKGMQGVPGQNTPFRK